jgi:hypothetical protein
MPFLTAGLEMASRDTKFWFVLVTYRMEQSPSWETNRFSASQEISCILWNLMVHYRIHKFTTPVPYLEPAWSSPYPHIPLP